METGIDGELAGETVLADPVVQARQAARVRGDGAAADLIGPAAELTAA
jgi:hypothetical protein